MNRTARAISIFALFVSLIALLAPEPALAAGPREPLPSPPAEDVAPAVPGGRAPAESIRRWRERRFGLFVHWGPVSLTGREIGWSRAGPRRGHRSGHGSQTPVEVYDHLYEKFNPVRFDADEWVRIARAAGMRYLVFTSKHHDGFVNFDSKLTDYKITSPRSPYRKDIVRQIADACHRAGLAVGWYYSPPDWHHPDYRNGDRHARYIEYLHGQIRELLTSYGKIDILWFDGLGGRAEDWDAPRLLAMARELQPGIVINNRAGLPGDHDTPEQRIGGFNRERPWETCMTICRQWAWKPGDKMKSRVECLRTLLRVVGGDGNLLFNVGPMPDGRIEPRQVERLREMGAWLAKHGDGVYATRGGPYRPGRWGASSCRGDRIWLYIMEWPSEGPLELPPLGRPVLEARARSGAEAKVEAGEDALRVSLPAADRDEVATVIELRVEGDAFSIAPVSANRSGSLAAGKKATASNVYRGQSGFSAARAFDDDPSTRWATDAGTHQAWIEVDLGRPATLARVRIDECVEFGQRVRKFQLRVQTDGGWRTALEGTRIGAGFTRSLPGVRTRLVRLEILDATDGPTIREIQLFGPGK